MLPIGGLSLFIHSLLVFGGFIKKTLGLKTQEIKGKFLLWSLKINPRFCFALFAKDSFLQRISAYAIIAGFLCLVLINLYFSFIYFTKNGSGSVLIADLVKTGLAMVSERNISPPEFTVKFNEVPFAKEILQADFNPSDF